MRTLRHALAFFLPILVAVLFNLATAPAAFGCGQLGGGNCRTATLGFGDLATFLHTLLGAVSVTLP